MATGEGAPGSFTFAVRSRTLGQTGEGAPGSFTGPRRGGGSSGQGMSINLRIKAEAERRAAARREAVRREVARKELIKAKEMAARKEAIKKEAARRELKRALSKAKSKKSVFDIDFTILRNQKTH